MNTAIMVRKKKEKLSHQVLMREKTMVRRMIVKKVLSQITIRLSKFLTTIRPEPNRIIRITSHMPLLLKMSNNLRPKVIR